MAAEPQRFPPVPYYDEPLATWDNPLLRYDDPRTAAEILNSNLTPAMFDVVLDLRNLSIPALILRLRGIRAGIAADASFSSLAADLTALDTLIDTLEANQTSLEAKQAAITAATEVRDESKQAAVEAVNGLATNVGKIATSVGQVEATTLRVKSAPGPKPIPDRPTGLELSIGDEDGELSGQCEGQPGIVDFFEIFYTTTDPNAAEPDWQFSATSKKSRFDLENLPSGQKVWVRLRACNARGKSPWSDPACKRVP